VADRRPFREFPLVDELLEVAVILCVPADLLVDEIGPAVAEVPDGAPAPG
jgi:hypothetical protein